MKSIYKILCGATLMLGMALTSCTKAEVDTTDENALHTCTMTLVGSINEFDQTPGTKAGAGTTEWKDGSVIYLRLNSPMGATTGKATYKKSTNVWTLEYYGSLYTDVANACTAIYVEDEKSVEGNVITLTENTAIYEDTAGSYLFKEDDLVVAANLKPLTGRIRFQGTAGTEMKVYGINHYTTYDNSTNLFQNTNEVLVTTVGSDGYTPYIYGFFTTNSEPFIGLWIDAKEAYTRYCSEKVIKVGESGKMTVPTSTSHGGWSDGLIFTVNNYKFKMVAVEGGTFTMGKEGSTEAKFLPHQVTVSGFCIGECEVTRGMLGYSSDVNKPYVYDYPISIPSAMTNLGYPFLLPTEAQWEFAARGGNKSHGYLYSGSNTFSEVGVTSSSSSNTSYYSNVKTKLPNELGLYDMTGNAYENIRDKYAVYPSSAQINPCVTSGSDYLYRSGNPVYDRNYSQGSYKGYRLVFEW